MKNLLFILLSISLTYCNINDSVEDNLSQSFTLDLLGEYQINVPEPSGLTFGENKSVLWTVSDQTNHIYKISLTGNILEELNFTGNDLEGIAFDKYTNTLWIVEEQRREVINLDCNGIEISRHYINTPGSGNSGFEGICITDSSKFAILNEKDPRNFVLLNNNFSVNTNIEISEVLDLSGMDYEDSTNNFWILSDQSKKILVWNPTDKLIKTYKLDFEKAEGIAVDLSANKVYIVNDATQKLYVFKINE